MCVHLQVLKPLPFTISTQTSKSSIQSLSCVFLSTPTGHYPCGNHDLRCQRQPPTHAAFNGEPGLVRQGKGLVPPIQVRLPLHSKLLLMRQLISFFSVAAPAPSHPYRNTRTNKHTYEAYNTCLHTQATSGASDQRRRRAVAAVCSPHSHC